MTILGSISSIGNVKSSVSSSSISNNYQSLSKMSLNSIQCGGNSNTGCGNPVLPLVGGVLTTTGTIIGGVLNVVGGTVNGLLMGGGGCN